MGDSSLEPSLQEAEGRLNNALKNSDSHSKKSAPPIERYLDEALVRAL
jgi:hypothetical protein